MKELSTYPTLKHDLRFQRPERRAEQVAAVAKGDAYLVEGWTATLQANEGTMTLPIAPGAVTIPHQEDSRSTKPDHSA